MKKAQYLRKVFVFVMRNASLCTKIRRIVIHVTHSDKQVVAQAIPHNVLRNIIILYKQLVSA